METLVETTTPKNRRIRRNPTAIPCVYNDMRFISVFYQRDSPYAVGFDEHSDAFDLLYWGYEEYELLPCGIYDVLTGEVTCYRHREEIVVDAEEELIRSTAINYLKSAVRMK